MTIKLCLNWHKEDYVYLLKEAFKRVEFANIYAWQYGINFVITTWIGL